MSTPSTTTPAARIRTTLPAVEPTSTGRPRPTRCSGLSTYTSPTYRPGGISTVAPAGAASTRRCTGDASRTAGRPSIMDAAGAAVMSACPANARATNRNDGFIYVSTVNTAGSSSRHARNRAMKSSTTASVNMYEPAAGYE